MKEGEWDRRSREKTRGRESKRKIIEGTNIREREREREREKEREREREGGREIEKQILSLSQQL